MKECKEYNPTVCEVCRECFCRICWMHGGSMDGDIYICERCFDLKSLFL